MIIAEARIVETAGNSIVTTKTLFAVRPGETVEALMNRIGFTGLVEWHYAQAEVRLKLVKKPEGWHTKENEK